MAVVRHEKTRGELKRMAQTQPPETLVRLSDSKLTVANRAEDIRGREVLDKNGGNLGKVDDLMIDDVEHKVRFPQVESGGFLGLGETRILIPVDAITKIDDKVHINHTREHVARAPRYNPELVKDEAYLGSIYGHYGYPVFWEPGYAYPMYPFYL